jgi:hypothetical protein
MLALNQLPAIDYLCSFMPEYHIGTNKTTTATPTIGFTFTTSNLLYMTKIYFTSVSGKGKR